LKEIIIWGMDEGEMLMVRGMFRREVVVLTSWCTDMETNIMFWNLFQVSQTYTVLDYYFIGLKKDIFLQNISRLFSLWMSWRWSCIITYFVSDFIHCMVFKSLTNLKTLKNYCFLKDGSSFVFKFLVHRSGIARSTELNRISAFCSFHLKKKDETSLET
jgi:hypothetical protein